MWGMAVRSLERNARRTLATGTSIAIGVFALLVLSGFLQSIERYLKVVHVYVLNVGHLAVYREGGLVNQFEADGETTFSADAGRNLKQALLADDNVEQVGTYLRTSGLISNGCRGVPYRAVGMDSSIERWEVGRAIVKQVAPALSGFVRGNGLWANAGVPGAALLSVGLAEELGKSRVYADFRNPEEVDPWLDCEDPKVRERFDDDASVQLLSRTVDGSVAAGEGLVTGIFSTGLLDFEEDTIYARLAELQQMHGTTNVSNLAAFLKDATDIERRAAELERKLEADGFAVDVYPWNDERVSPTYVGATKMLLGLGGFVLILVLVVVWMAMLNTVNLSLLERRRELGTLRAIGFSRRRLTRLVTFEGTLLTALAGMGGTLGAACCAVAINSLGREFRFPGMAAEMPLKINLDAKIVILVWLLTTVFGAAATWMTARKALREAPSGQLRTVV